MSKMEQARVTAKNVTLDNCDCEQIQFSNAVQPHTVLLVVDPESHKILQASANAGELTGASELDGLIGSSLSELLTEDDYQQFREKASAIVEPAAPKHLLTAELPAGSGQQRDVLVHRNSNSFLLELERQGPHVQWAQARLYEELRSGIAELNTASSLQGFLNQAVKVVARCTGFERVMAYRFHEDGSGEVVAEDVAEGLRRYLGLHYPAADIPKPARRLFSLSWVRHLPDVGYEPVPILPEIHPVTGDLVDLSFGFSRSVSVMYTEYLKNMGVQATLVLTLFKGGDLWGLISCMHHSAPRHLNIEVRATCEMLAQMISLLMSAKEDAELAVYRESLSANLEQMHELMARGTPVPAALATQDTNMLSAIHASGAAIVLEGQITLLGDTPSEDQVAGLVSRITRHIQQGVWSTDCLAMDYEVGGAILAKASGVLAVRIGRGESDLLLWFRPEYRQTVSWAGDPSKLVVKSAGPQARLHPDGSFDVWNSEVRGRAQPWRECEIDFARRLGLGILEVVLERAREVAWLTDALSRSNRELDEFVFTASHDLKSPLRGITNHAQVLLRGGGKQLEEEDQKRLRSIMRLSRRMDGLIQGLLQYSELGHASLTRDSVDLHEVCSHALEMLRPEIEKRSVEIRMDRPLPCARCDYKWVGQVLLSLITNAVKYNDKSSSWVEIGYLGETIDRNNDAPSTTVFFIRDNGIGIAKEHTDAVFRLFHRLHSADDFGGGTGLGLAIASRAIERHHGKLWLESQPGEGTTFFFTLGGDGMHASPEG